MTYYEMTVTVRESDVEAAANVMWEAGSGGVVLLEDPPRVRAYFPHDESWPTRMQDILESLVSIGDIDSRNIELIEVREEDWANTWKQYYHPITVDPSLVIVPAWQDHPEQPGRKIIRLDPGMAFGTGTHASTFLCLEALQRLLHSGDRVLDVGTGSGILAIAAALLGASRVAAIDIDPVAVRVAHENIRLNEVDDRVEVRLASPAEMAVAEPRRADLLLANLTADIIQQVASDLSACLAQGGRFVVSGFVEGGLPVVREKLSEVGLTVEDQLEREGWFALMGRA